jgi:hypothetical protein
LDIPVNMLRQLLSKVTAAVHARLLKAAPPEMREKIQQAIDANGVRADQYQGATAGGLHLVRGDRAGLESCGQAG